MSVQVCTVHTLQQYCCWDNRWRPLVAQKSGLRSFRRFECMRTKYLFQQRSICYFGWLHPIRALAWPVKQIYFRLGAFPHQYFFHRCIIMDKYCMCVCIRLYAHILLRPYLWFLWRIRRSYPAQIHKSRIYLLCSVSIRVILLSDVVWCCCCFYCCWK